MSVRKRTRPYILALEEMGCTVEALNTTGTAHYQIVYTCKGKTRKTTIPHSPSDHRSFLNWRGDIRRALNGDGNA